MWWWALLLIKIDEILGNLAFISTVAIEFKKRRKEKQECDKLVFGTSPIEWFEHFQILKLWQLLLCTCTFSRFWSGFWSWIHIVHAYSGYLERFVKMSQRGESNRFWSDIWCWIYIVYYYLGDFIITKSHFHPR